MYKTVIIVQELQKLQGCHRYVYFLKWIWRQTEALTNKSTDTESPLINSSAAAVCAS